MPNGRRLKKRPLATTRRSTSAGTFGRCSRLCPLRRSLSSQRIASGQGAPNTSTKGRAHETPERVAATSSQPYAFRSAAYAWLRRRETAASLPNSDGRPMANTKRHESSIQRSRTLPSLCGGSQLLGGRAHMYHARIARQVRSAHAPLAAKGRPMRSSKWRFAVAHGRPRSHSLAQRQRPSTSSPARLEPSGFTAEVWPLIRRIPTAIQWQTRRVTNRPSEDPGPCRRCTAALSCSADAPTCITLGTHARSGPRMRRSPQRAVPCGRRNGATLSPTDAPEPTAWRRGSTHPDHRMRGRNRVASPQRVGRIPAGFRRPSDGKHVGSRIVHPKIPDLAAAARRLAASQRTHPHIYRSDRTPGPVCACAARREGPSHAVIEMALRCRPRTPATPQLGGEAAPIQIIA